MTWDIWFIGWDGEGIDLLCAQVRDKWNLFHILPYLFTCGNKLGQRPRAWTPSKLFKWNKIIALISNVNERHGSRQGDFGMSWLVKFFLNLGRDRFLRYKTLNINNYLYRKTFTGFTFIPSVLVSKQIIIKIFMIICYKDFYDY